MIPAWRPVKVVTPLTIKDVAEVGIGPTNAAPVLAGAKREASGWCVSLSCVFGENAQKNH